MSHTAQARIYQPALQGSLALDTRRSQFTVIEGGAARSRNTCRKDNSIHGAAGSFVFGVLVLALLAAIWAGSDHIIRRHTAAALAAASYETITVLPGDSLWQIAEEHSVDGCTTGRLVAHLRELNDLTSSALSAGMQLRVPVA